MAFIIFFLKSLKKLKKLELSSLNLRCTPSVILGADLNFESSIRCAFSNKQFFNYKYAIAVKGITFSRQHVSFESNFVIVQGLEMAYLFLKNEISYSCDAIGLMSKNGIATTTFMATPIGK